jgi:hypothetical protein
MRMFGYCLFVVALVASCPAHAGTVNGSATLLENGQPALGANIALYQDTTPFTQVLLDQTVIGASGTFSFSAPDVGQFRLVTTLAGRVSETQPFAGSVNTLAFNFALSLPSSISITVRDAITLQPIQGATVDFFSNGLGTGLASTGVNGIASLSGIRGGSYVACLINTEDAYLNECNDNQHLPLGNAIQGIAPFALAGGQNLALTLDLDATGASVSGTLTNRHLITPIAQAMSFTLFDVNGVQLAQARLTSNAIGTYTLRGLAPGTFFLRASSSGGSNYYSPRVFPDLNCASSCNVTLGTPITITGSESVANIDFLLHPGSVVTGRVTEAGTGTGLANVGISAAGDFIFIGWGQVAQTTTAIDGSYTLAHIPPTQTLQYRVGTQRASTHINQSWPNIPCFGPACFEGSSVPLARDEVRNGIDFQLTPAASFSGSVLEQTSAQSLDATVFFQNENGTISSDFQHDSTAPTYSSPGLPPGTYFAYARRQSNTIQQCQVYFGLPCGSPNPINTATATPIVITGTGVTTGVDFAFDDAAVFKDGFEL